VAVNSSAVFSILNSANVYSYVRLQTWQFWDVAIYKSGVRVFNVLKHENWAEQNNLASLQRINYRITANWQAPLHLRTSWRYINLVLLLLEIQQTTVPWHRWQLCRDTDDILEVVTDRLRRSYSPKVTYPSWTSDRWKLAVINSLSYPEQTLNGHVVDCYCYCLVEYIHRY